MDVVIFFHSFCEHGGCECWKGVCKSHKMRNHQIFSTEGLSSSSATCFHKWGQECDPEFLALCLQLLQRGQAFSALQSSWLLFLPPSDSAELVEETCLFQGESSCGVDSSVVTVTGWAELTLRACTQMYCSLPDQLTTLTMHCSKPHCR